jgi:hypothetical protein
LGSSSHTIVDIHNIERNYKLGNMIGFELGCKSLLFFTGCL